MIKILIPILFLIQACVTAPEKPASKEAQVSISQKIAKYRSMLSGKKSASAIKELDKIIYANPDNEASNEANMILGNFFSKQEKNKQALSYYMAIVNSPYYSKKEFIARVMAAEVIWKNKDPFSSLELLEPIFKYDAPPKLTYRAHILRAEIYKFNENYLEALRSFVFLSLNSNNQTQSDSYKSLANEITEYRLDRAALLKVVNDRDFDFARTQALLKVGKIYFEESDYSRSKSYFNDVISKAPNSAISEEAEDFILQIDSRSKINQKTIGIILPLSGRLGKLGYKVLNGVQLGLGVFGNNPSDFKLAIIDSEANPNIARRAVEKLVVDDHVIAIIGSIKGKTSLAIAKKSQELGIPTIGFSLNSEITTTGDYIFRNALTSQMQVKALVRTAMQEHDIKNFAILYPNGTYGVEFANMFWDEVLAKGGNITGAQAYDVDEKDFRDPIRRLVGTYYREDRFDEYKIRLQEWENKYGASTRKKVPEDLLPPIIDFQAIFIPDTPRALGQIAPMLVYNDVTTPFLLGTDFWNTKTIAKRAGSFKDKVIYIDAFANPNIKSYKAFSTEFENTFGRKPSSYETMAYESSKLLREIIEEQGADTRTSLKNALLGVKSYPGIHGELTVNSVGDIERELQARSINQKKKKTVK
ncbi:MAG: penicillin-binding protein activator [Bdellovibrionales bacterium]